MRDFDSRKSEPNGGFRDPFMNSARPWGPPKKTSAQIIKQIDLKYGDHVTEKMEDPKGEVLAASRRPSALSPTEDFAPTKFHREEDQKIVREEKREKTSVAKTLSSDSAISNDSSSGGSSTLGGRNSAKPQFYFGQNVSSVVKSSPFFDQQQQTAIDKVKKNEALTHPKLSKPKPKHEHEEQKISVKESSNARGRYSTTVEPPNVVKVVRNKSQSVSPSLSSTVSSLSSPTSTSSSSSSVSLTKQRLEQLNLKNTNNNNNSNSSNDEEEFLVPRPKLPAANSSQFSNSSSHGRSSRHSVPTAFSNNSSRKNVAEESQEQIQRAFEAELVQGKSRLRKLSSGLTPNNRHSRPLASSVFNSPSFQQSLEVREVGVPARMPPAPVPPPPPPSFAAPNPPRPPPVVSLKPVNGEIPQAPKLTHFGTPHNEPQRKGLVAPNGINAR